VGVFPRGCALPVGVFSPWLADQPASRPPGQPASRPAGQPASRPAGQPAGQPASQPASRPAGPPAGRVAGHYSTCMPKPNHAT